MIQLSILKITGYGPWTLTLGSDREHELQMLQASLYKKIQKLFSDLNSLVFQNRSDEFFVVSNKISLENHIEIQKNLEKEFEIKLNISIGYGDTPYDANLMAYDAKKNKIFLSEQYKIFGKICPDTNPQVTIMHLDVDDITSRAKTNSPYEISSIIFQLYSKMSKFFLEKNSLTFFMGGDNFMVVATDSAKKATSQFIEMIKQEEKIFLNCGIGNAVTCREAIKLATKSLDTIREIRDSGKEKPEIYELSC